MHTNGRTALSRFEQKNMLHSLADAPLRMSSARERSAPLKLIRDLSIDGVEIERHDMFDIRWSCCRLFESVARSCMQPRQSQALREHDGVQEVH